MLNENIKALRKAKGLSQEELSMKLNVVRQTVSKWEKGLSVPDAGMLIKIADALDTTVNILLGEEAPEQEEHESIKAIAAKLALLNEQFAQRSERNRKVWHTIFICVGMIALAGVIREILSFAHLSHFNNMLASSTSIIGGADKPTSIFVSTLSFRRLSALTTIIASIVAAAGLYHTRRK